MGSNLTLGLRAKNSNGKHYLFFDRDDDGGYSLTLTGEYKGEPIQIDFEPLTGDDVEDYISLLRSKKQ